MVHVSASYIKYPPVAIQKSKSEHQTASLCVYLSHPEGGVISIVGGGVPHGLPPSAAALGEAAEVIRQWRSARKADGAEVLRVRRLCPDSASAGGGASSGYAGIMMNYLSLNFDIIPVPLHYLSKMRHTECA